MNFQLYTGNQLEVLAARFAESRHADQATDPLRPETVVVQTRGMAIWLQQFIAATDGIAANLRFPFLNSFISEVLLRQLPEEPFHPEEFSPDALRWRIFRELTEHPEVGPELAAYLQHPDQPELRRYQLAGRLAHLFDQYQIYRPELLAEWRHRLPETPSERWQAALWRTLCADRLSRADYLLKFLNRPVELDSEMGVINVFGVGTMPPVFLAVFAKLARCSTVRFFYLNPCADYWADQPDRRQREPELPGLLPREEAEGNPLLAAFGRQGREFLETLLSLDDDILALEESCFTPYGGDSALHQVQQDILELTNRGVGGVPPTPLAPDDVSISFHNCHSIRREVEVLHDYLLRELDGGKLQPRDLMVMAPDISRFAPYIRAVFDAGPLAGKYAISDRSLQQSNQLAVAFLELLELAGSRYECSRVTDLLEHPALRRKFRLGDSELEQLRDWIERSGIRWGIDGEMRRELLDYPFETYSWRRGLDRLLLGLALEEVPEAENALPELMPVAAAEAPESQLLLGRFCNLVRRLFDCRRAFRQPRTPEQWQRELEYRLEEFFEVDRAELAELTALKQLIRSFGTGAVAAGCRFPVGFEVVREALAGALAGPGESDAFLRGRITFCSLLPMRSIPKPVIALLGMDDGEFPRREPHLGFNLIARQLRPGDRNRQWEDRYLFLEALLSARSKLLIFYCGQNQREAEAELRPPAVPVGELQEYLNQAFRSADGEAVATALTRKHRLQGFDREYFDAGESLFTYSAESARVAKSVLERKSGDSPRRFRDGLSIAEPKLPDTPEPRELERFWLNPSAYFLERQLGFPPAESEPEAELDLEPLELDGLERYQLRERLGRYLAGHTPSPAELEQLRERWEQENRLPVGEAGTLAFAELRQEAELLDEPEFRARFARQQSFAVEFTLPESGLRVGGTLSADPDGRGVALCRFTTVKAQDFLRLYLRHLTLAAAAEPGSEPVHSVLRGRNRAERWELHGPDPLTARRRWEEFWTLFQQGQREPLPFLPEAAWRFITAPGRDPWAAAREGFHQTRFGGFETGDYRHEAVRLLYQPEDFDDPEFQRRFARCAEFVFGWLREPDGGTK